MDAGFAWGFIACAALSGAGLCVLLGVRALMAQVKRIDAVEGENERLNGIIDQLDKNTKAIDPTKSALEDERDFQEALLSLKLLMGYFNRKSPGALKLLIDEEFAPHRVTPTRRAN